ncbi:MAG: LCP family protein [Anaerolineae bacterium]
MGHVPVPRRRRAIPRRALVMGVLGLVLLVAGFQTGQAAHRQLDHAAAALNEFVGGDSFAPLRALGALVGRVSGMAADAAVWGGREPVNILVLGTDGRPGDGSLARADTIFVLSLDPVAKTADLVSIPRDLWFSIPGYGEARINTAYWYGEIDDHSGGGPALTRATVEDLLGIEIPHFVQVNFDGFARLVDLLGGVPIQVEESIWDPLFPDDAYGYRPLQIPAGVHAMDGRTLLAYLRTRYEGDDLDRMGRQQKALRALAERALDVGIIPRLPGLMGEWGHAVTTDLSSWELLALANLGREIGLDGLETHIIDDALFTRSVTWDGAQVLLPDTAGIRTFVEEVMGP